jgi:hypothetical protein
MLNGGTAPKAELHLVFVVSDIVVISIWDVDERRDLRGW